MFKFNKNYEDLDQVKEFLPRFIILHAQGLKYNAEFEGKIDGIQGDDEKTAIFLLQGLKRREDTKIKRQDAIARGFTEVENSGDRTRRYESAIVFDDYEWKEYEKPSIIFSEKLGLPEGLIPKGNRTRGCRLVGKRVLVK